MKLPVELLEDRIEAAVVRVRLPEPRVPISNGRVGTVYKIRVTDEAPLVAVSRVRIQQNGVFDDVPLLPVVLAFARNLLGRREFALLGEAQDSVPNRVGRAEASRLLERGDDRGDGCRGRRPGHGLEDDLVFRADVWESHRRLRGGHRLVIVGSLPC